ncbi:MAG: hypothetical protein Q8R98_27795 [Rubrivivax sp.]|nr:hypothetical protein [Rubrivivax sp.]
MIITVTREGFEVPAFCIKDFQNPERIKAIAVPDDVRALCT